MLPSSTTARPRAFTVLELLIVVGVIGLLLALLLPALMSAREAARRTTCASHLRQIGAAIHEYHDQAKRLPAAWRPAKNDPRFAYGWAAQILSNLEQSNFGRQLRLDRRPDATLDPAAPSLAVLLCPSDITEPTFELWEGTEGDEPDEPGVKTASVPNPDESALPIVKLPTANYQGVFGTVEADEADEAPRAAGSTFGDGAIIHDANVTWASLERGLSNTLLVGERTMSKIPSTWIGVDLRGADAACRLVGSAITHPNCDRCDECEFTSRHAEGAAFLWADGHVAIIGDDVDPVVYQQSSRRDAG
jgi:prepilin-type processing-associated H-X9-DG protein